MKGTDDRVERIQDKNQREELLVSRNCFHCRGNQKNGSLSESGGIHSVLYFHNKRYSSLPVIVHQFGKKWCSYESGEREGNLKSMVLKWPCWHFIWERRGELYKEALYSLCQGQCRMYKDTYWRIVACGGGKMCFSSLLCSGSSAKQEAKAFTKRDKNVLWKNVCHCLFRAWMEESHQSGHT